MAFSTEPVRTAVEVGDITVTLYLPHPESSEVAGASYSVPVIFSDGSIVVRSGNLGPHLSQAQINGLMSFMNDMRAKAIDEFLP